VRHFDALKPRNNGRRRAARRPRSNSGPGRKFKGSTALKRKVNPTLVPTKEKETVRWLDNLAQATKLLGAPKRCVHIGDRESDIFELFCLAQDIGTHFVVLTCNNTQPGCTHAAIGSTLLRSHGSSSPAHYE
jgi:hypothetical protein